MCFFFFFLIEKFSLLKSYVATGGTLLVSDGPGAMVRDAPNSIASKLRTDPSIQILQSLEKCLKEKDASWLEKFVAAGGAAATLDVIALKVDQNSIYIFFFK